MKKRIISIRTNEAPLSLETKLLLQKKLEGSGFIVKDDFDPEAELLISIGGDGATLSAIHQYDFPQIPIIGVNTGHLGFFQEMNPDQLDEFIVQYNAGQYKLQPTTAVQILLRTREKEYTYKGFNEIVIKGSHSSSAHFNISIGDSFIERFSGDGILVATSAGSTGHNYSLGGSIVDPRLKVLQVTPMAPMNTTAYRSFTSSLLLPPDMSLHVKPEYPKDNSTYIVNDGMEHCHRDIQSIEIGFSDTVVNLLRFENYDFWSKVKSKFL